MLLIQLVVLDTIRNLLQRLEFQTCVFNWSNCVKRGFVFCVQFGRLIVKAHSAQVNFYRFKFTDEFLIYHTFVTLNRLPKASPTRWPSSIN